MKRLRHKTPLPGGRRNAWASVHPAIRRAVEQQSVRFGVPMSWVIEVALGDILGIEVEQFVDTKTKYWAKPLTVVRRRG